MNGRKYRQRSNYNTHIQQVAKGAPFEDLLAKVYLLREQKLVNYAAHSYSRMATALTERMRDIRSLLLVDCP